MYYYRGIMCFFFHMSDASWVHHSFDRVLTKSPHFIFDVWRALNRQPVDQLGHPGRASTREALGGRGIWPYALPQRAACSHGRPCWGSGVPHRARGPPAPNAGCGGLDMAAQQCLGGDARSRPRGVPLILFLNFRHITSGAV